MPPGTYQAHCIGCTDLNVSTSLRWNRNLAFGKNGVPRLALAVDRPVVPMVKPQVLHVQVVEADEVDVGRRDARRRRSPPSTVL